MSDASIVRFTLFVKLPSPPLTPAAEKLWVPLLRGARDRSIVSTANEIRGILWADLYLGWSNGLTPAETLLPLTPQSDAVNFPSLNNVLLANEALSHSHLWFRDTTFEPDPPSPDPNEEIYRVDEAGFSFTFWLRSPMLPRYIRFTLQGGLAPPADWVAPVLEIQFNVGQSVAKRVDKVFIIDSIACRNLYEEQADKAVSIINFKDEPLRTMLVEKRWLFARRSAPHFVTPAILDNGLLLSVPLPLELSESGAKIQLNWNHTVSSPGDTHVTYALACQYTRDRWNQPFAGENHQALLPLGGLPGFRGGTPAGEPPHVRLVQRSVFRGENKLQLSLHCYSDALPGPTAPGDWALVDLQSPLAIWNSLQRQYLHGLQTAEQPSAVSSAPRIASWKAQAGSLWQIVYHADDLNPSATWYEPTDLRVNLYALTLLHWPPGPVVQADAVGIGKVYFDARMEFSGLQNFAAKPLSRTMSVGLPVWQPVMVSTPEQPAHRFEIGLSDVRDLGPSRSNAPQETVRFGALDLLFDKNSHERESAVENRRFQFRTEGNLWLSSYGMSSTALIRFEAQRILIYLEGVRPGGEDDAQDTVYRDAVIVLPYPQRFPSAQGIPLYLVVEENPEPNRIHALRLRLQRPPSDATREAQRLDSSPRFDAVFLDGHLPSAVRINCIWDPDAHEEIGFWEYVPGRPAVWAVRRASEGTRLVLPPQGIGEDSVKDYTEPKEQHDWYPENGLPTRYRFTPPAILETVPGSALARYEEPPWNLRRQLLGSAVCRPGLVLQSMQVELLYGMSATVTERNLRIADVAVPLGDYPPLLDIDGITVLEQPSADCPAADAMQAAYAKAVSSYAADLLTLGSRLRWLRLMDKDDGLTDVPLENEVSFEFRAQRKIVYPILPRNNVPLEPLPGYTPADEGGVHGGLDWGFESRAVLAQTTEKGRSTSGEIRRFAASLLGGTGYQKAEFINGLVKVYSDTYLGRTFFYSVERLGRIGVFWNKAKHVIVYERTVSHSAQFQEVGSREELKYLGRPVLRKVREFIELLEPERAFPDKNSASYFPGAITGMHFESTIIPVDSKWGTDIYDSNGDTPSKTVGWKIPLFRRGAKPAYVYKEPNIRLLFAAPPPPEAAAEEAAEQRVRGRILNPENLFFFTDTTQDNPDTDAWPALVTVDYPPKGVPVSPNTPGFDQHAPDAPQPDAPSTPAGYARYTYRVDMGDNRLNLMHGRRNDVLLAKIEAVTCARQALISVPMHAGAIRTALENIDIAGGNFVGEVSKELLAAGALIEGIANKQINPAQAQAEFKRLKDKFAAANEAAWQNLGTLKTEFEDKILPALNGPKTVVELIAKHQNVINAHAQSAIVEFKKKIDDELAAIVATLNGDVYSISQRLHDVMMRTRDKVLAQRNLLEEAVERFERAAEGFEQWALELATFLPRAQRRLEEAQLAGDETYRRAALTLAREVQTRMNALRSLLTGSFPALPLDLAISRVGLGAGEEYRTLLDLIVGIARDVGGTGAAKPKMESPYVICAEIEDFAEQLRRQVGAIPGEIRDEIDLFEKTLEDLFGTAAIEEKLDEFIGDLPNLKSMFDNWFHHGTTSAVAAANELEEYLRNSVGKEAEDFFRNATGEFSDTFAAASAAMAEKMKRAAVLLDTLEHLAAGVGASADQMREELRRLLAVATEDVSQAWRAMNDVLEGHALEIEPPIILGNYKQLAGEGMRLLHAHGLAPVADALKLNMERIGYYFQQELRELPNVIDITPAAALFNRAGSVLDALDGLKSLSVRVPTRQLAERFLPNSISNFDLKSILPSIAGLDLTKLLNGVNFPLDGNEGLKVTHGVNPTDLSAWARCDIDLKISGEREVFAFGPVTVKLSEARLRGRTELRAKAGQGFDRSVEAKLQGDWSLSFAGQKLVTLVSTELRLDESGRIKFDVSADKIRLNQVLEFLTDLLSSFGGPRSGVTFELVYDDRKFPVGARLALNLPLPAVQTGAFSISNVWLRCGFEVAAPGGEFYVGVYVGLSDPFRPFTLTILILAGGGWVSGRAFYFPFRDGGNQIAAEADVGLAVGAALPFDIGVARGGVSILLSLSVTFRSGNGSNRFDLVLRIAARGEVVVLGFISVYILIALEARYSDGGLKCTGILEISIKIGWFFEFSISTSVSFSFLPGGRGAGAMRRIAHAAPQPGNPASDRIRARTQLHWVGIR